MTTTLNINNIKNKIIVLITIQPSLPQLTICCESCDHCDEFSFAATSTRKTNAFLDILFLLDFDDTSTAACLSFLLLTVSTRFIAVILCIQHEQQQLTISSELFTSAVLHMRNNIRNWTKIISDRKVSN